MFCRGGGSGRLTWTKEGNRGFTPRILEGYLENGARRNRAGWVGAELGGGVVAGR